MPRPTTVVRLPNGELAAFFNEESGIPTVRTKSSLMAPDDAPVHLSIRAMNAHARAFRDKCALLDAIEKAERTTTTRPPVSPAHLR